MRLFRAAAQSRWCSVETLRCLWKHEKHDDQQYLIHRNVRRQHLRIYSLLPQNITLHYRAVEFRVHKEGMYACFVARFNNSTSVMPEDPILGDSNRWTIRHAFKTSSGSSRITEQAVCLHTHRRLHIWWQHPTNVIHCGALQKSSPNHQHNGTPEALRF